MASKKEEKEAVELSQPRLKTLSVKNFRCIGSKLVTIELDDIVVLVGPNNVGKSTILKAYQVVMSHGSKEGKLSLEDFPRGKVDPSKLPEVELVTVIKDSAPGAQWVRTNEDGEMEVRERWRWLEEGDPIRQGWNVQKNDWDDKVPWGAPNVAKSHRPEPHRVGAFDSPEEQSEAITKILMKELGDRVKNLESTVEEGNESSYGKLLENVKQIQKEIVKEAQAEISAVEGQLKSAIHEVFPNYIIKFDAKPEENLEESVSLFKSNPQLRMGPEGGFLCSIDRQGSGARRTLLWTALKVVSEKNSAKKSESRPQVLLLDEPEICLHPNAIREACNLLYDLPRKSNWQVMVTTHSPCFVDVSRDNTTIIRVEIDSSGDVAGTTIFRPSRAHLDDDDRRNLKLLNLCDPYVTEFFFGGRSIIVEGDTEYTAFNYVREKYPEHFKNIHIIRARGKATIVSLMKILNHFGNPYSVLHDVDKKTVKRKSGSEITNPAWSKNFDILEEAKKSTNKVTLVASIPTFEGAYFNEEAIDKEKPYSALMKLRESGEFFSNVCSLFEYLAGTGEKLPKNAIDWNSKEQIESLVV